MISKTMEKLLYGLLLAASAQALGQTCTSGDCQAGTISGPFTAAQVAENTATNFPICKSSSCTTGTWNQQIEGIDAQENVGTGNQFYDTATLNIDANVAVGATLTGKRGQVVEWVNNAFIQAFDKVTGAAIFSSAGTASTGIPRSIARLWSTATQAECRGNSTNVQVIYDRLDNEFVISRAVQYQAGGINHYAWCVAVSSSSDLSNTKTKWYAYEYKLDSVIPCVPSSSGCTTGTVYYHYPDWARVGTWSDGFYVTFDLEDPTKSFAERGFEACQLDRANMARGNASNPMTCYTYEVPVGKTPSLIHSVDVADIDSASGPSAGEPEYFLSLVNPSNLQQGSQGMAPCVAKLFPCLSNQLALFTWSGANGLSGPTFVTVNPYTPGCYDTSGTGTETNTVCIPEPSTPVGDIGAYGTPSCGDRVSVPCVDSLGDRMANRLTYNHLSSGGSGPNGGYLTASHVVLENTGNQSTGIRYYILQVSAGTATVLVNSGGTAGPPDLLDASNSLSYFMPSAALDQNGNLGMTYTTSGLLSDPVVSFDVLPWGTTALDTPTQIVQGSGDEENNYHWGEYAATVLDSTDNLTFYGVGEYFNTSQTGTSGCTAPSSNCYTWQTRIFRGQYGNPF